MSQPSATNPAQPSAPVPSLGRIVLVPMDPRHNNGADTAPAVISHVWSDSTVNVRILADGPDVEWRTSVVYTPDLGGFDGDPASLFRWSWPPRV